MTLTVSAFQALCGDFFLLSYQQNPDMIIRHIVIDAGYSQTYHRTLSVATRQIVKKNERIDLFVLTVYRQPKVDRWG
jgi:hypothetical protein